jgi:hypothetical protein
MQATALPSLDQASWNGKVGGLQHTLDFVFFGGGDQDDKEIVAAPGAGNRIVVIAHEYYSVQVNITLFLAQGTGGTTQVGPHVIISSQTRMVQFHEACVLAPNTALNSYAGDGAAIGPSGYWLATHYIITDL